MQRLRKEESFDSNADEQKRFENNCDTIVASSKLKIYNVTSFKKYHISITVTYACLYCRHWMNDYTGFKRSLKSEKKNYFKGISNYLKKFYQKFLA